MANWNPGQPPGPPGAPPPGAPPGGYGAPPPGGYGGGPPGGGFGMAPGGGAPIEGSFGLGFLAGFFGTCLGLALVYIIAKGPQTKKGALVGFGVGVAVSIVSRIISGLAH